MTNIRQDYGGYRKIEKAMEGHIITVDGIAVYDKGWSDQRIQEMMGGASKCSLASVAYVRKEIYGNTITRKPKAPVVTGEQWDELLRVIDRQAVRIRALEAWAAKRTRDPYTVKPSPTGPLFNGERNPAPPPGGDTGGVR